MAYTIEHDEETLNYTITYDEFLFTCTIIPDKDEF